MKKDIISRRDFFKKSTSKILPVVAAITLPSVLTSCEIDEEPFDIPSSGCKNGCSGKCSAYCGGTCQTNCSGSCKNGCTGNCKGACGSSCRYVCTGSAKYGY